MSVHDLAICGWTLTADPATTIRATLGVRAAATPIPAATGWRCEEPIPADTPVGPIARLLAVSSDKPVTLRFVPGSQGCAAPPPDEENAIEVVRLGGLTTLLLDGRCWYDAPPDVRAALWSSLTGGPS